MKTICFCGMDGCGKSTQTELFKRRLNDLGIHAEVIHILGRRVTVVSKAHGRPILRRIHYIVRTLPDYGIGRIIRLILGLANYFFDAWLTTVLHRIKFRNQVVIYDRFFYDQLVIFVSSFRKMPIEVMSFIKALPKCDANIILEVPPVLSRERKPEHSIELLNRYSELYRKLAGILKTEIVDGSRGKNKISDEIYHRCKDIIAKPI